MTNGPTKRTLKIALAGLFALGMMAISNPALANCGGCDGLRDAAVAISKVDSRNDTAVADATEQATNAITNLPKEKKNKLSAMQAREVVNLLQAAMKKDIYVIAEDCSDTLAANKSVLLDEAKRLPPADAKLVSAMIKDVVDSIDGGNDEAPKGPQSPKTKPSGK